MIIFGVTKKTTQQIVTQLDSKTRCDTAKHLSKSNLCPSELNTTGDMEAVLRQKDYLEGNMYATGHCCTPSGGKHSRYPLAKLNFHAFTLQGTYRNRDWLYPMRNTARDNTLRFDKKYQEKKKKTCTHLVTSKEAIKTSW